MNSPYQSPFGQPSQPSKPALPKNYSEVFKEEEYECKDSIELESYARNLRNYLLTLLQQEPFPAFLFEKLEKRLDGITTILMKRSVAGKIMSKTDATAKMRALERRLDTIAINPPTETTPQGMHDDVNHPPKKRKLEPRHVQEVREGMDSLRRLKQSYSSQSTLEVDDEEEED